MKIRNRHGRSRSRSGAAAVELALLLPVFCYICVAATDYSRVFYVLATLSDSARAGAIYYATRPSATNSGIQQAALADASDLNPAPTITTATGTDASGNAYMQVTAAYQFTTLMPYPGIPSTVNLSRQVTMMPNPP